MKENKFKKIHKKYFNSYVYYKINDFITWTVFQARVCFSGYFYGLAVWLQWRLHTWESCRPKTFPMILSHVQNATQ